MIYARRIRGLSSASFYFQGLSTLNIYIFKFKNFFARILNPALSYFRAADDLNGIDFDGSRLEVSVIVHCTVACLERKCNNMQYYYSPYEMVLSSIFFSRKI